MECVFCAIVAGEQPASVVYRDERVVAFMDICPATPWHLLVIPVHHAVGLTDLAPDDAARMMTVAQRIARAMKASPRVPADGINLFLADGESAFQEVFHAHLHVVPRTAGDGFVLQGSFHEPARAVLDRQAADLRGLLS